MARDHAPLAALSKTDGPDFFKAALDALNAGAPGLSHDMRKALAANIALRCRHAAALSQGHADAVAGERAKLPAVEFHQQDWIPGFAAFLPGATTPAPDSKAFCVINLGALLATVETGAVPAKDLPYFLAESMMHEVVHVIEQWARVEFSEERVEALCEKYRTPHSTEDEACR